MTPPSQARIRDLSDSGRHAVEHELLRYAIDEIRDRLGDLVTSIRSTGEATTECRDEIVHLRADLRHTASREDLVTAIAACRTSRQVTTTPAIDWRAIGRMVAIIIAAVSALAVALYGAIARPI